MTDCVAAFNMQYLMLTQNLQTVVSLCGLSRVAEGAIPPVGFLPWLHNPTVQ